MLAAVVIGVDKVGGGLPKLKAAASGAEDVADWLRRSGYRVTLLTDRDGPVEQKAIFQALASLVETGSVQRLVVYFGGHGFLNGPGDEFWVLSDAPFDASEAVNVSLSQHAARYLGIPEIVFISDACRIRAHSGVLGSIKGASIFPNVTPNQNDTEIDLYYGTWPGDPALERDSVEAEGAHGLFTQELLLAHRAAPPEALLKVGEREYVRSRWLKEVLQDRVDARASEIALRLTQRPDIQLQTAEGYIAEHERVADARLNHGPLLDRIHGSVEGDGGGDGTSTGRPVNVKHRARKDRSSGSNGRLSRGGLRRSSPRTLTHDASDAVIEKNRDVSIVRSAARWSPEFLTRVDILRNADPLDTRYQRDGSGETLTCSGDIMEEIALGPGITIRDGFESGVTKVSFDIRRSASQVAVRFGDGTGMLLPMLSHYDCEIVRQDGRTLLVGYDWVYYRDPGLLDLRAQVISAATLGLLDRTRRTAHKLAREVRKGKKFDPTLGLVAALAYTIAGDHKGAVSVRRYMRKDLLVDLFDSWLLGGAGTDGPPMVPALPLLSQTWSFLDLFDAPVAEDAKQLKRVPGFWTVFEPESMDLVMQSVLNLREGGDVDV